MFHADLPSASVVMCFDKVLSAKNFKQLIRTDSIFVAGNKTSKLFMFQNQMKQLFGGWFG